MPLNDALLFRNKGNEIHFIPPPPQRLRDTNGCDMVTRTCVCLFQQPVTQTQTLRQKKTHEVSTQWPLTLYMVVNPYGNLCLSQL